MRKFIPEMLNEINNDTTTIAKYRGDAPLRMIFEYAFLPEKKMCLPEGDPPFKPDAAPIGMSPANLLMELRKLYVFTPERELNQNRRESLFIQLLENVHPDEAKVLLAIKDQKLDKLYKNIDINFAIDNGFLPETARPPKIEPKKAEVPAEKTEAKPKVEKPKKSKESVSEQSSAG